MLRKGFTLIELLIVITIIAILAGSAIPYVQDYVEDARLAKARADLGELRNAIIRYETETGKIFVPGDEANWQSDLVGPYLQQAVTDPWGSPYYIHHEGSIIFSAAEDRSPDTNIISLDFRPALAPTRAYWVDIDQSSGINAGDFVDIKFTRPIGVVGAIANYAVTGVANFDTSTPAAHPIKGDNWVRITLAGAVSLVAGRDEIIVADAIKDTAALGATPPFSAAPTPNSCRQIPVIIRAAQ